MALPVGVLSGGCGCCDWWVLWWLLYNNNNKIINENITIKMCKTFTKQIFCSQNYYNIVFYYNSQNTQIQVLKKTENKK